MYYVVYRCICSGVYRTYGMSTKAIFPINWNTHKLSVCILESMYQLWAVGVGIQIRATETIGEVYVTVYLGASATEQ